MPPNPAVKLRSNDQEAISPPGETASDLRLWSGRPDLNRRPLDPQTTAAGPASASGSVSAGQGLPVSCEYGPVRCNPHSL